MAAATIIYMSQTPVYHCVTLTLMFLDGEAGTSWGSQHRTRDRLKSGTSYSQVCQLDTRRKCLILNFFHNLTCNSVDKEKEFTSLFYEMLSLVFKDKRVTFLMKDLFFCSGILIHLPNDGGPLGIHVVPDYDDSGK